MAYAVRGDPQYLKILENAYEYWQKTQCYATGGFGPAEKTMPCDGALRPRRCFLPRPLDIPLAGSTSNSVTRN